MTSLLIASITIRGAQSARLLCPQPSWVVVSALWIAAVYWLAHKDRLMPRTAGETAVWALIPTAVALSLFFVLRWIVRSAERRFGD